MFSYKITYENVTEESAEFGDASERGFDAGQSEGYDSLREMLEHLAGMGNWIEWSSSSQPNPSRDWIVSEGNIDPKTGIETTNFLHLIKSDDDWTLTEIDLVSTLLDIDSIPGSNINSDNKKFPEEWAEYFNENLGDSEVANYKKLAMKDDPEETEDGIFVYREYLGTVFSLYPSGKYYQPFACGNVSETEAEWDSNWFETLEKHLNKYDAWIESGEGDPCDLHICFRVEK